MNDPASLRYFLGLDLGPTHEPSALAVVERDVVQGVTHYAVRDLRRWPGGTPYAMIAADVRKLLVNPPLCGCHVRLDQTAVGRAVKTLFKNMLGDDIVRSLVVTGGQAVSSRDDGAAWVPRRELASVVQVQLQGRRLRVAAELALADTLARELAMFRTHMPTLSENAVEPWRKRPEDDLVLAVAMALWDGEREPVCFGVPMVLGRRY